MLKWTGNDIMEIKWIVMTNITRSWTGILPGISNVWKTTQLQSQSGGQFLRLWKGDVPLRLDTINIPYVNPDVPKGSTTPTSGPQNYEIAKIKKITLDLLLRYRYQCLLVYVSVTAWLSFNLNMNVVLYVLKLLHKPRNHLILFCPWSENS